MNVRRGSVWWADLGAPSGSAPALRRPVVVVQADGYNASRLATVIVVALTTTLRLGAMPGNVHVPAGASGLPTDSVANVTQLATLDRDDLVEEVGDLSRWTLDELDTGLRQVLAL